MKKALRIIPLILALALLAACGTEPAAETPDVTSAETPQPTASPEPSPEAERPAFRSISPSRGRFRWFGLPDYASPSRNTTSPSPSASPGARCCCAGRTRAAASASPALYELRAGGRGLRPARRKHRGRRGGSGHPRTGRRAGALPAAARRGECPRGGVLSRRAGERPCARTATCPTWTR